MKINSQVRYGMRAMVEISRADQNIGIFQKDISANQKISVKYLDHIIRSLKTAGLITNINGKKSGYRLTRPAVEITPLDIFRAFEPEIAVVDCLSKFVSCEMELVCPTRGFWGGLNEMISNYFGSVTLEDLATGKKKFSE